LSPLGPIVSPKKEGKKMEFWIFGAVLAILGLLWAILALQDDPLEEGIRQAQAWEAKQKRLRKVLS
jgi:hypothetical protein